MPRTNRLLIAKLFLLCLSVGFSVFAIELGARVHERLFLEPEELDMFQFRVRRPAPYRDSAYFSKEFVIESFQQPGGSDTPTGTRLVIPRDYDGVWFHVAKGLRFTEGQPADFQHTIYVFGGSTVYSGEVPDALTLPSQLQSLVNEQYGDRYRVENYGMTTVTTSQELERLRTIKPRRGDVVIFYDGVNDVFQEVYYARPKETMIERNRRVIREFSAVERFLIDLSKHSAFARNWTSPINYVDIPKHLRDEEKLTTLVSSLQGRFAKNIMDARKYAVRHKAHFFHFLQPNIYTLKKPSTYEVQVMRNPKLYAPPGMDVVFYQAYPLLREVSAGLRATKTVDAFDLSEILDPRESDEEHYLDICHVADRANFIIASRIFRDIKQVLDADLEGNRF
jgi:hypothetical protein